MRPFREDDAETMFHAWASDPEVTKYLTWNPHTSVEQSRHIIGVWISEYEKPERLNFAITLKESGELIGGIDVVGYLGGVGGTPVIGYCLSRKHWNRGYMTEACMRVLALLRERGYSEVRIDAMTENVGSNRVILKCGGEYIGTEADPRPMKNDVVPVNRYIVRL
ncbi:MAG: GNAT family N-acetyltransferase [Clostridia bacterium]|nr:GNAT family N-acetyltransferase [Clostridia bacterium]